MANPVCYIVNKNIDGYIAAKWGWSSVRGDKGMNPAKVCSLRGLYDQNAEEMGTAPLLPDNPTKEDLDKAFEKLMKFRAGIKAAHVAKMAKGTRHIDRAWDALRGAYSLHQRKSRINLLSNLFSWEVDRLMSDNPTANRQAVVNGFNTIDGQHIGGELSILEGVYNGILQTKSNWHWLASFPEQGFQHYKDKGMLNFTGAPTNVEQFKQMCEHRVREYHKILECWNELVPFVLKDLVKKEGVKLGIKKEFASAASSDNFGENDIASKWDMSESKRDGWMENSDMQSAFGSVGQQVRRILATVPQVELVPEYEVTTDLDGRPKRIFKGMKSIPVVDDLGNPMFMDAQKTHQALQDYLRGIQDSEQMLEKLCKKGKPGEAKIPWMQPIVDILVSNPQARTQFFCDFKKNFQPYSVMWEDKREGNGFIKSIKTRILNRPLNMLKGKYDMVMSTRGKFPMNVKMWGYTPVFDEATKEINWQRLAELRKKVLDWTHEEIDPNAAVFGQVYGAGNVPLINNSRNATITIDGKTVPLTYEMRREFLMEVFTSLGYDVTVDTIDSILQSRDIYTVREQLEQLFDPKGKTGILYAANVKTLGDKNVQTLQAKHMKFRSLYNKDTEVGKVVREHSEKLLDIINKHQEGYRVESRARYQGNTMYSHVAPSYLGDRLETIQNFVENNDKQGLQQFLTEEYLQSPFFVDDEYLATNGQSGRILNMWLAELMAACKDSKTPLLDSVAAIFNYERDLGNEEKKFEDFTSREHGIDMLVHFFADEQQKKGYGGKGSRDIRKKLSAMYPVFILGDAGVSKYIRAPRITSAVYVNKEGKVVDAADNTRHHVEYRFDAAAQDRVIEQFWNIYMQEKRRMALDDAITHDMYANGKKVNHPKGEFSILTFLNPSSQEYQDKYAIPAGKEFDESTIRQIIRQYMDDATQTFLRRLDTLGVLETANQGKNKKVFRNISSFATPENINAKIQEFFWNTKLATANQLQIMTIDPSFYHGTKDLQKRYKEIHAPGSVLDVMARDFDGLLYSPDGIERVAYFDDINVNAEDTNPEFMKMIELNFGKDSDIYKQYKKNTLTDGQGYRTLTSYRKVMGMAGKWTRNMEEAYKTIMQIRNKHIADDSEITDDERQQIADFMLVLQPIKPYMFTHEKYPVKIAKRDAHGNVVMGTNGQPLMIDTYQYIPVQHKYAEALIIPELMPKGSKLRDLANWMEANNVDMVGSTKIGKVGVFGQANLSGVKDKASLNTAMDAAYIHELPYKDYRIQTNVPEHINSSQLFGTQVRKLIMSGLDMVRGHYEPYLEGVGNFEGHVNLSTDDGATNANASLDGRNLLALYNSLICANIFDSYEKFTQNAGDIEELSNLLQQSTIGSMREAMDNLFAYVVTGDDKFLIPLFEGGMEHDTAALILSTFKKIVNKQQISGGSAVQVSAFGIDGYEEDGGLRYVADPDNEANILYAEIEMPFDKSFLLDVRDAKGNVTKKSVSLSYDKYCYPNGYLIPSGNPIEKGTREWKKYQSYTYKEIDGKLVPCKHDDPEAKVYKPLIETEYPDILSILAYRIPTERDYSMINCQIKRFTPKTAGGTLKVPPQGTTIAGFDFDIDKLYFMQREYHKHYKDSSYTESNFSEAQKYEVWGAFYAQNPEVRDALANAQAAAMQSDPANHAMTKTLPNGRTITRPKNALNSYWEAAGISEKFGIDKHIAFAETAQREGIKPTQNLVQGESLEWMEEYDFNKSPEDNTRAARNNLLITLIQARLMDPQTVKQRYTPGGFANASKAARLMRELFHGDLSSVFNGTTVDIAALEQRQDSDTDPEPNYDPTDPYTILVYNQQNQVASKLIGIFANQNTNHAFASSMDVFELNEPIAFCGKSLKDLLHKGDKEEAARIDLNMAEFLAASVDAVKDPVLNFLNLNTITADAGALLARLGYSTKEIGLLFNQPIIRKACQDAFNRGANIKTTVEDAKSKLMSYLTGVNLNDNIAISENDLALGIVKERQLLEEGKTQDDFLAQNARMQYAVLDLFSKILTASQDVSNFVLSTKFTASNAVSSTMGGMYAQQMKVDAYVDKFPGQKTDEGSLSYRMVVAPTAKGAGVMSMPIENKEDLTTMSKKEYLHYVRFNPFAYEQAMYDANRKMIKLLSKYFPYERPLYSTMRAKMQDLARFGTLSEDDINDIHSNIPVALLAKQSRSLFNGEATHVKDGLEMNMTNREYYREKFAEDLMDMIAADPDGLGKLEIFKYLTPEFYDIDMGINPETGLANPPKEAWKISMQDIGGMDADTKEAIRESWAYLMEVKEDGYFDSKEYAELGRDLFMYCFYQLGFDFSPKSFMHLAPVAVKDSIIVERSQSLPLKGFTNYHESDNDVVVWSPNVVGGYERAEDYGANKAVEGELTGSSFQLPENLTFAAIEALINEAKSHPELTFKIDRDLSQEEFDKFTKNFIGQDVPSNIRFSQATLDNVSQESKERVSYGKSRTYRQFLNEILDGTEQGLNSDEFAQMWILNHLDNTRFVFDTAKSSDDLRKIIREITSRPGNTLRDEKGKLKDRFVMDISSYDNDKDRDALSNLVKVSAPDGKIVRVTWAPCIKIGDSYYMAESGTDLGFNVNKQLSITYRKVSPWGTSKTIDYDGNQKLTPQMRYQTSLDAVPQRNENYVDPMDKVPMEAPAQTVASNSSQYSAAVHEALEAVKPQGANWNAVEESVLNIDGLYHQEVWPKLARTVPNWRSITEEQRTAIADALIEYNTPSQSNGMDSSENSEPLTDQSNGNAGGLGALRYSLEDAIFTEFVNANEAAGNIMMAEDKENLRRHLQGLNDQDIMDTINAIRRACRDGNGVLMLSADGELMEGC